jgi:tripartite-type tricarboxylate transporter receptor subunit TctC
MMHRLPSRVKATKFPRRQLLHLAEGAAALPAVSRIARAQTYPTRPMRLIVPYPAGTGSDITARFDRSMAARPARQFEGAVIADLWPNAFAC